MKGFPPGLPARAALLVGLLGAMSAVADVRSTRVVLATRDLAVAPDGTDDLRRAGDRTAPSAGWHVSSAIDPGFPFSSVGAHWSGAPDALLELSVSPDGASWGRWIAVPPGEAIPPTREDGEPNPYGGEAAGPLVFVDPASRFVRCRVRAAGEQATRVPDRVSLHVIDPGPTPRADRPASRDGLSATTGQAAGDAPEGPRRAAVPEPEVPSVLPGPGSPKTSSRASWGARPPRAGYTYTVATHVALHHTASVEDFQAATWDACAARMRAIQTYHVDTNGWNDVGYAYVVCRHGDVFQGREDDDDTRDVQGAHDGFNRGSAGISAVGYFHPPVDQQPTPEQLSAIVSLTAWIAGRRGIDPLGRSLYEAFGAPVENVYGHRDVSATACPGDHLHRLLGPLRAEVAARVLRQVW